MTGVYNKDKLRAQYNDRGAQHGQTEGKYNDRGAQHGKTEDIVQ